MRDILITLIVFGAIPYILKRPHIGIYVWSWLSYMNPHRFSWGFAYNMPFAAVTACALFIGLISTKDKNKFPITPVTIVWLLLMLWITFSTFTAINFDISIVEWKRVVKIQLITFVTLLVITNKERLNLLIAAISLSVGFFGIKGGIFVLATAGSYKVWGPPGSFIEGNNELALGLLMIIPFLWYLRGQYNNPWLKRFLLASIFLCAFSIISSYSRGALVAFAAVLCMFWAKSNNKLLIGLVLIVASIGILSFMPDGYSDRMNTIQTYEEDASAMGRINAWTFAYNLAKDHPLTGGGFGAFTHELFYIYAPVPEDHHDAHSIYFEVLGEQGFVGLFLFLMLWFLSYQSCNKTKRMVKNNKDLSWADSLASMCQVSLVAYGIGGAFLGLAYFDLPYHIMAIIVLCNLFVTQTLSAENQRSKQTII